MDDQPCSSLALTGKVGTRTTAMASERIGVIRTKNGSKHLKLRGAGMFHGDFFTGNILRGIVKMTCHFAALGVTSAVLDVGQDSETPWLAAGPQWLA